MTGSLYIVGTPIGNLEDVSDRALNVLRQVDLIASENPSRTQRLLATAQPARQLLEGSLLVQHAALFELQCRQQCQRGIGRLARHHAGCRRSTVGQQDAEHALLFLDDGSRRPSRPHHGFQRQLR